jgi:flagellar M-ring protein FliF
VPTPLVQFTELWSRLKTGQQVTLIAAVMGTVALIGALVYYGMQPEYGVLFSDLKPGDAQAMVEKLQAANVPYRITQGGTMVSVPSERVAEMRLQMASAGVLTGGHVGFAIFDKGNFGATDFTQRVNYQRALEGELARTLEAMDEVEAARVHITQPRESVFTEKAERAKSSVVVRLRQGRQFSRERSEAIINLVASAVEGLDPADITVMDTQGRLLSTPSRNQTQAGGAAAFNSHLEARHKLEEELAARVVTMLEPITGRGHVRANVAAELDFSQTEQTDEKYNPQSAVIRSQQTSQELRNGSAKAIGGVVGARANNPATPPPAVEPPATAPTNDQRTAATTNYEIDKTVKRTVNNGGRVTRLSVSVVVDYKTANGAAAARPPEELKKMQDLVAAAVGIDTARGDQIVVQTIPFESAAAATEMAPPGWLERYREWIKLGIKYGALLLAALVLMLFVVRPAKRALRQAAQQSEPLLLSSGAETALGSAAEYHRISDAQPAGLSVAEQESSLAEYSPAQPHLTAEEQALESEIPRTVAEMEEQIERETIQIRQEVKRSTVIRKRILDRSQKEPELVAMTIRSWLQENKTSNRTD